MLYEDTDRGVTLGQLGRIGQTVRTHCPDASAGSDPLRLNDDHPGEQGRGPQRMPALFERLGKKARCHARISSPRRHTNPHMTRRPVAEQEDRRRFGDSELTAVDGHVSTRPHLGEAKTHLAVFIQTTKLPSAPLPRTGCSRRDCLQNQPSRSLAVPAHAHKAERKHSRGTSDEDLHSPDHSGSLGVHAKGLLLSLVSRQFPDHPVSARYPSHKACRISTLQMMCKHMTVTSVPIV